ncbi:MAG: TGS domain-containing protein, partial [Lachnospiraceae bacterium]|nr:TGS domain-containing protein [Lachnospiraceae bacterium]
MCIVTMDGVQKEYPQGITYEEIVREGENEPGDEAVLVRVNGKVRELCKHLEGDCIIEKIRRSDTMGHKTYVRSAIFLFVKAATDTIGAEHIEELKVEFAIGKGYYISARGDFTPSEELAGRIEKRMREMTEAKLPIIKQTYPSAEAVAMFAENGMSDKEKLFRYRRSSSINVYTLDGYHDYYYGFMMPNTDYIRYYEVLCHENGFILNLPDMGNPKELVPFAPQKKLFDTLVESERWSHLFGLDTIGDLNDQICFGNISDLILVQEAQQE